jgi:hypothetical protein
VANPIWLQHADYLHHSPYASFFGAGCLYFLSRYLDTDDRRWLPASGAFLFFTYLSSYDYWVFVPALIALMVWSRRRTVDRTGVATVAFLAAFAVLALIFKFGTNAWVLGGVHSFIHDLRFQFSERATDKVTQTAWVHGIWPTAYGRVDRFFTLLLFPIALLWLLEPIWRLQVRGWKRVGPNPTFLFVAAVPFLWIFTEVWIAQYYPTLLVVPYYAVACAALAAAAWRSQARLARAGGALLVVVLLGNSVLETATFKKAFFTRADIAALRTELDAVSPLGRAVLVNNTFDAFYRYYFDRNTVAVFLNPPEQMNAAIAFYADPRHTPFATSQGAIFVQHKHLPEQEYDKGYYYLASRYGLWNLWAEPTVYHEAVDALIAARDSQFVSKIAAGSDKLVETDAFVVWRVRPPVIISDGRTPAPSRRN